jgi:Fic family protein
MVDILQRVENLQQELRALLPMKREFQAELDKKFLLDFNFNSNHLEGNTLTHGETMLLLFFGETKGNHTLREYEEMRAHNDGLELIKQWARDGERPLTEIDIKNLNRLILVKPFWKEAVTPDGQSTRREISIGEYKQFPNSVRLENGAMFEYASPTDTPIQMGELMRWFRAAEHNKELHPVEAAGLLHYKFVCIHPFDDGNGRISRLLMNYVLYKNDLPPIVIKSADKKNYLSALHRADSGDIGAFIEYLYEQFTWSLELSIKAAKGGELEEPDDYEKEIALWKRQVKATEAEPKRRDNTVIYNLYHNSIQELLQALNNKFLANFQDMFHLITMRSRWNGELRKSIQSVSDTIHSRYQDYALEDATTNLSIHFTFEEYKYNSINPFSVKAELVCSFDPYLYRVQYAGKILEKKYGEYLSEEEKKEIVADCIKAVFEEIKQKSVS